MHAEKYYMLCTCVSVCIYIEGTSDIKHDQIPYSEWSHPFFDPWKMISDYILYVLIPLSASPNPVSDLGEKSVRTYLKHEREAHARSEIDTPLIQIRLQILSMNPESGIRSKDPSDPFYNTRSGDYIQSQYIFIYIFYTSAHPKNPSWTLINSVSILIQPFFAESCLSFYRDFFVPGDPLQLGESRSLLTDEGYSV